MQPPEPAQGPAKLAALIVGQGLAGTCLAWTLESMGLDFRIVDPGTDAHGEPTSSRLAAGLVTPLTGPRLTVNWRYRELLDVADPFYRDTETRLRAALAAALPETSLRPDPWWQPVEIVRLLLDPGLKQAWDKRRANPEAAALVDRELPGPTVEPEQAAAPHGAFVMTGRRLDCPGWLNASRALWKLSGKLIESRLDPAELEITPDFVQWRSVRAEVAVWCVGAEANHLPWFGSPVTRHQIGDVLRLDPLPQLVGRVINGGAWLMSDLDADAQPLTRAGATYFQADQPVPDEQQAREQLLRRLGRLAIPLPRVRDQKRAVRPVFAGRKLVAGRSTTEPRVAWLNGFGSKGVLKAPFFARNLSQHLWRGQPLDPAALDPTVSRVRSTSRGHLPRWGEASR